MAAERVRAIDTSHASSNKPPSFRHLLLVCRAPAVIPASLIAELPGLKLVTEVDIADATTLRKVIQQHELEPDFLLNFERDQLLLCRADEKGRFDKQRIALEASAVGRRVGSSTELHRACLGGNAGDRVQVLDLFAGWGMDAFSLAAAGARVTCVEQQPAMVALLRDAMRRVHADISQQVKIVHGDALGFLGALRSGELDVIYLDPMFPSRNKGALPSQRLQWLAQLTAGDLVAIDTLIEIALSKAKKQVVLKRRRKDPIIGVPGRQISGSSVRYDVYN